MWMHQRCYSLSILKWLFLTLIGFTFIAYVIYQWIDSTRCFMYNEESTKIGLHLGDVLLTHPQPISDRSIFFLETSCHKEPTILKLSTRQACAIESAALHNPNFQVFVLFASPRYYEQDNEKDAVIKAILSYPNVHLRRLNLVEYAAGTPIENWLKSRELWKSSYLIAHTSDLLRLITLYRFGGIYLDTDVVLLRSLEKVPLNYAGAESDTAIANGVMSLSHSGFGHKFANSCLLEFQKHFAAEEWSTNGPGVITRVALKNCDSKNITTMLKNQKSCPDFKVFDPSAFYAVHWTEWQQFFMPEFMEKTLEKTRDSYLIHVWNKHSHDTPIIVGSSTAYGKIAAQNCPKSYAAAGEFF